MQDQSKNDSKPFSELRDALFHLDYANDSILEAERELAKAKQAFGDKLRALSPVWVKAVDAAAKMGEELPDAFREGGLLIRFDEEGVASADRLPDAASSHTLYTLANKAGE
ncbi:hypothetical protein [Stutzerimonas kunmingensis]|uniref:hypothetical protein n=1 Tax=Stutzerimonas kunmingensis TaxID=1211807 RepID=UPI00241D25B8|nr:hypothetical protein [Stutzerimonas kunmingensis]